ncbi:hypothetical protein RvY_05532-2 [Ramazzottius varieornatus]|uniref:One cut domain family member n=1 Tax=Ramazzottius varieornatus TaxID=947166 RepID=A0A1D1UVA6_RAMVA|nr:hypothetical protein RvY_05532-2 [Ramazzottius varieornatus]
MVAIGSTGLNRGVERKGVLHVTMNVYMWLPVVPEMDAMTASGDGMHESNMHDSSNGGSGNGGGGGGGNGNNGGHGSNSDPMMSSASGHDLGSRSPNMTNSVICDGGDFRVMSSSDSSQTAAQAAAAATLNNYAATFNGRLSPSQFSGNSGTSYATLTPFQPLPPISSVTSEKFSHQPVATPQGFHFITPNHQLSVHNITNTYQYAAGFTPLTAVSHQGSAAAIGGYTGSTSPFSSANVHSANGVSLTIQLPGGLAVQSNFLPHQSMQQHQQEPSENSHHDRSTPNNHNGSSPANSPTSSPRSGGGGNGRNGQIVVDNSPTNSHHSQGSAPGNTSNGTDMKHRTSHRATSNSSNLKNANQTADEMEEINTKELAQRISAELKRYSIPQAIFAQRVLCRSQGTLSDLLRNPKPWSKLKSGRETFRRMGKWLEEPEFQRMSALRLAGAWTPTPPSAPQAPPAVVPQVTLKRVKQEEQVQPQHQAHEDSPEGNAQQPKKPRLVFTDIQRRTLQQIFQETKRPNKEMQLAIAQQLGLELSTVGNFFMNARRRSQDKWQDGDSTEKKKDGKGRVKKEPRTVSDGEVKMENA